MKHINIELFRRIALPRGYERCAEKACSARVKAAQWRDDWHSKDGSEQTIVTWLKSMGWTVEVNDMRDDEADEEEE